MATKPGQVPLWDTTETNSEEPAAGLIDTGWGTDAVPPSAYFNWWQNLVGKWAAYLNDGLYADIAAAAWVWSNTHDFQGDQFIVSGAESYLNSPYLEIAAQFIQLTRAATATDPIRMKLGDNTNDGTLKRARITVILDSVWITGNAEYHEADQKWYRLDAGSASYGVRIGARVNGLSALPAFVFYSNAATDGWLSSAWDASDTQFGAGQGQLEIKAPQLCSTFTGGFTNTWAAGDLSGAAAPAANKDAQGFVHFVGHLKAGASSGTNGAFTLPPEMRPGSDRYLTVYNYDAASAWIMKITTAGVVSFLGSVTSGHRIMIDGATFS